MLQELYKGKITLELSAGKTARARNTKTLNIHSNSTRDEGKKYRYFFHGKSTCNIDVIKHDMPNF